MADRVPEAIRLVLGGQIGQHGGGCLPMRWEYDVFERSVLPLFTDPSSATTRSTPFFRGPYSVETLLSSESDHAQEKCHPGSLY